MNKYLTFPANIAPVHPGVYQRQFRGCFGKLSWLWARWENGKWYIAYDNFPMAKTANSLSAYQLEERLAGPFMSPLNWRGLRKKPE